MYHTIVIYSRRHGRHQSATAETRVSRYGGTTAAIGFTVLWVFFSEYPLIRHVYVVVPVSETDARKVSRSKRVRLAEQFLSSADGGEECANTQKIRKTVTGYRRNRHERYGDWAPNRGIAELQSQSCYVINISIYCAFVRLVMSLNAQNVIYEYMHRFWRIFNFYQGEGGLVTTIR